MRQPRMVNQLLTNTRHRWAALAGLVAVVASACIGPLDDSDAAEANAAGQAQFDRQLDNPIAMPLDIAELVVVDETRQAGGSGVPDAIFGERPVGGARFAFEYELADGVSTEQGFDAAVQALLDLGAEPSETLNPTSRVFVATSLGDELTIEIKEITDRRQADFDHVVTMKLETPD